MAGAYKVVQQHDMTVVQYLVASNRGIFRMEEYMHMIVIQYPEKLGTLQSCVYVVQPYLQGMDSVRVLCQQQRPGHNEVKQSDNSKECP